VKTWDEMTETSLQDMSLDLVKEAKLNGYSDVQIAGAVKGGAPEDVVRSRRVGARIGPVTKQIDTLAADSLQILITCTCLLIELKRTPSLLAVVSWYSEVAPTELVRRLGSISAVIVIFVPCAVWDTRLLW